MISMARKPFVFENKSLQTAFETLPTRNILKIDENRLIELQLFAAQMKDGMISRNISYYRSNSTLKDFFSNAVRILSSINSDNFLGGFNFQFSNLDEIGLVIMLIADSELKYLSEYKHVYSINNNAEEARNRLETVFGFYSPKLHTIELHYKLVLDKLSKEYSHNIRMNK
ncbi:MAG: hypothetical protein IJO33_05470 [Bacilli bacterium]|nr:hypothetical protein [Bacilli bacterium]